MVQDLAELQGATHLRLGSKSNKAEQKVQSFTAKVDVVDGAIKTKEVFVQLSIAKVSLTGMVNSSTPVPCPCTISLSSNARAF